MDNNENQKNLGLIQCSNNMKKKNLVLAQCSNKKKKIDDMMEDNQEQKMIGKKNFLMQCSNKKKRVEKESGEITAVSNLMQSFSDSSHSSKNVYCFFRPINNTDSLVLYKINPSNSNLCSNKVIPTITSVCSSPLSQVGYGFSPAIIGSKLYTIGGGHNPHSEEGASKDVYCIDTQNQDETLVLRKLEANTLANRLGSGVVSTHGKIYVFGAMSGKPEPWGEVFDPYLNQWSPLPKPPNELLNDNGAVVHAVVGDKILMLYEENLTSFDLKTNSWDPLVINSLSNSGKWYKNGTIVDDVLFLYKPASVIGYDLVADKWFKEPVRGLELESMSFRDPVALTQGRVAHLGEHFLCVIWRDILDDSLEELDDSHEELDDSHEELDDSHEEFYLRCVKFRVSRIYDADNEEDILQAEVQARSAYRMLSGGNFLVDCIPM